MKRKLYTVYVIFLVNFKRVFRDRLALFFTFLFPLIFLFIFGGLFGRDQNVSFNVAIINHSHSSFANQFVTQAEAKKQTLLKVNKDITSLSAADERMGRGELDATIELPPDFETPFTVTSKQSNTRSLSRFDYTFTGLLGFAILGMGIFGPMNVFPELKKMGILRRLHTTPLRVWQYFLATMLGQAVVGLMSLTIMFIVAILVFHLKVVGNYVELAAFLVFGITTILGIGLSLGGWAKNERQVAPLANIIVFPMMFLSGTFFPRYLMPDWLQNITSYMPLTPIIDGARLIATEGKHIIDLGPQLGVMAIWLIIVYVIAFRVFRWE